MSTAILCYDATMSTDGKERLVEATRRVISQHGMAAATMRAIAREAGLSTGAIYHYYKNREEILYDVMSVSLSETTRISEETRRGHHSHDEIIEEICVNIRRRFDKSDENRLQFYLAQEALSGNTELLAKFGDKYREWIKGNEELLIWLYGDKGGSSRPAVAALLLAAIDGSLLQQMLQATASDADQITEFYRQFLRVGIPRFLEHLDSLGQAPLP